MAQNLWQKERNGMLRDLIRDYLNEGYDHKEAKKLATKEVNEVMEDRSSFVDILWEDAFDDC